MLNSHWRDRTRRFERLNMPSGAQMLEWFLWGVFMGGGWVIVTWLLGKVLR
jgi:hypothetical protein